MKRIRTLLLLSSLFMGACSMAPRVEVVPQAPPEVKINLGINDGFHGSIPPDIVDHYCGWGGERWVRSPVENSDQLHELIESISSCPSLSSIILVEKNNLDLVKNLVEGGIPPQVKAVELGNELELPPLELGGREYLDFITKGYKILREGGFKGDIISGGVYTVNNQEIFDTYLKPLQQACPDCIVGIHWYGSKDKIWRDKLMGLEMPLAVTECGKPSRTPEEDLKQKQEILDCINAAKLVGARYVIIYQRPSGPGPSDLDNFGLERVDKTWKGADSLFVEGVR